MDVWVKVDKRHFHFRKEGDEWMVIDDAPPPPPMNCYCTTLVPILDIGSSATEAAKKVCHRENPRLAFDLYRVACLHAVGMQTLSPATPSYARPARIAMYKIGQSCKKVLWHVPVNMFLRFTQEEISWIIKSLREGGSSAVVTTWEENGVIHIHNHGVVVGTICPFPYLFPRVGEETFLLWTHLDE